jgi:hypothetical protein
MTVKNVALTEEQLEAIILLIESGCALTGPVSMSLRPPLLDCLPALRDALDDYGKKRYVVIKRNEEGIGPVLTRAGNPHVYTRYAHADRVAKDFNDRALREGKQTGMVVAQRWEERFWVRLADE